MTTPSDPNEKSVDTARLSEDSRGRRGHWYGAWPRAPRRWPRRLAESGAAEAPVHRRAEASRCCSATSASRATSTEQRPPSRSNDGVDVEVELVTFPILLDQSEIELSSGQLQLRRHVAGLHQGAALDAGRLVHRAG